MAQANTIKIKAEKGFTVINRSEFDSSKDEIYLADGEMLVNPKGVDGAEPFVVDRKDFDANAYEEVETTKANLEIVSSQVPRKTLAESLDNASIADITEPVSESFPDKKDDKKNQPKTLKK